jgi:hypothetical protein
MTMVHDFNEAALRRAAVRLADSIGRTGLSGSTLDAAAELRVLADHLGYGGDLLSLIECDTQSATHTPPRTSD